MARQQTPILIVQMFPTLEARLISLLEEVIVRSSSLGQPELPTRVFYFFFTRTNRSATVAADCENQPLVRAVIRSIK